MEAMAPVGFEKKVDYYAGCYRLHKRFAPVPMDLESTDQVFAKIRGLEVNRISSSAVLLQTRRPEAHDG